MKKRIFCLAIMLAMLLGIAPLQGMAAEATDVDVRFGKFLIGIDYIVSAQIGDANVIGVTKLEATPEEGENNRLHYKVELSQFTQDGTVVLVDMDISQQSSSGIGSALKKELVDRVDARNDNDDTHYEITMENGKGRMICYSYYQNTQYTTLVIDFVVGNSGEPYVAPEKVRIGDDMIGNFHVWDTDIMKSYCKKVDYENSVVYIWLEEDVPDDAVIGIQPLLSGCKITDAPEGWNDRGGYVQLEDGYAELSFMLKGTVSPKLGATRLYKVYIKNHMSYAPERIAGSQVELRAEINIPFTIKFSDYFMDKDGDTLSYEVSVNGEPATSQTSNRYRLVPSEVGKTVLTVTANDGILKSEPCEITIHAEDGHIWSEWSVLKNSTCSEDGIKTRVCRCCGFTEQQTILSENHKWSDWIVSKKATCLENGSKIHTCMVCGEKDTAEIEKGDHDWIVTSSTATCGKNGVEKLKCSACGTTSERSADATELHVWSEWNVVTPSSCTEKGLESRSCEGCGRTESQDIPVTDHDWDVWKITTAPDCGSAGKQTRTCKACGSTETGDVPVLGEHSWGIWNVVEEPTSEKEGLRERICSVCGTTDTENIPLEQFAYVSISDRGNLMLARKTVPLEDRNYNGICDIDDILIGAHSIYGNANDYVSDGQFISMLWGIPSMSIGFLLDDEYVTTLNKKVVHGADIYAFVYKDWGNFSDKYSSFDQKDVAVGVGEPVDLWLKSYAYQEMPQFVSSVPITIDGKKSAYKTDANGKVTLTFDTPGTYVVSALSGSYVITPPVCIVSVSSESIVSLDAPVIADANGTATSVVVTPPEASAQDPSAVLEYSISENGDHWSAWQQNNVFEDLKSSSRYYVRARYCSSDPMRFENSGASQSIEVQTLGLNGVIVTLGDVVAAPGETVLIPVSLQTDPISVSRWNFAFLFDKSVFTMNGITAANGMDDWTLKANLFSKTAYGVPAGGGALEMPNGECFLLSLTVRDDASEGVYAVSLSNTWNVGLKNTFFDENGQYLKVEGQSVAASVTVTKDRNAETTENGSADSSDKTLDAALTFADVTENTWYYEPVQNVAKIGWMQGTDKETFSPEVVTSRAMLVTMLYRVEGEPAVASEHSFTDVKEGTWYTDAVNWAAENGIIFGVGENTFAPDAEVTRQQMATILYRYASYLGEDISASADLGIFSDSVMVADYAADAMAWAVAEGLILGTGENLEPDSAATRAQAAAVFYRYLEK